MSSTSAYHSPVPTSSMESLNRAAEMAGHATACPYTGTADFLEPDYARWRTRRWASFVPFLVACMALCVVLLAT